MAVTSQVYHEQAFNDAVDSMMTDYRKGRLSKLELRNIIDEVRVQMDCIETDEELEDA